MTAILRLDPFLISSLSDATLSHLQSSLVSLFSANSGDFSVQCSLFIASRIVKICELSKSPRLWDLFTLASTTPTTTTVMATGYVCRRVGAQFKSQLPHLITILLKQKPALDYAVAYCLRGIFKSMAVVVATFISPTIEFAADHFRALAKRRLSRV
jgi:hypothetical protein